MLRRRGETSLRSKFNKWIAFFIILEIRNAKIPASQFLLQCIIFSINKILWLKKKREWIFNLRMDVTRKHKVLWTSWIFMLNALFSMFWESRLMVDCSNLWKRKKSYDHLIIVKWMRLSFFMVSADLTLRAFWRLRKFSM